MTDDTAVRRLFAAGSLLLSYPDAAQFFATRSLGPQQHPPAIARPDAHEFDQPVLGLDFQRLVAALLHSA